MALLKLTQSKVNSLTAPVDKMQEFYRDTKLTGFAVRITASGFKSFIVETGVHGRVRRKSIGRCDEMTLEQARSKAHQLLTHIANIKYKERSEGYYKFIRDIRDSDKK